VSLGLRWDGRLWARNQFSNFGAINNLEDYSQKRGHHPQFLFERGDIRFFAGGCIKGGLFVE
jgi:hypothetical protein